MKIEWRELGGRHFYCCLCGWVFVARFAWRDIGISGRWAPWPTRLHPANMWHTGYLLASYDWADWRDFPGNRR